MFNGKMKAAAIEIGIERAIEGMRARLAEPLSIDDMAGFAMYSKFHFSREFQRMTGVSPGRFLSAMRIQEAKRLLLGTTLTVTEISHTVGYSSVGTFSSRFAASVGIPPSMYRRFGGFIDRFGNFAKAANPGVVRGAATAAEDVEPGLIFLGLFPSRVPEGKPVACTVLRELGTFEITNAPFGTWYLLGHSVPASAHEALMDDQAVHVGNYGPFDIRPGSETVHAEFRLRGMRILDPPVLTALQRVRSEAFERDLVPAAR